LASSPVFPIAGHDDPVDDDVSPGLQADREAIIAGRPRGAGDQFPVDFNFVGSYRQVAAYLPGLSLWHYKLGGVDVLGEGLGEVMAVPSSATTG
jgi:hypothetical protein